MYLGLEEKKVLQESSNGQIVHDVVIIGAGISGITAGAQLEKQGLNVCLLEARERIGGRIVTDKTTFSKPVDLGASYFHGTPNNILATVAKDFGFELHRVNSTLVYQSNGELMPVSLSRRLLNQLWSVHNNAVNDRGENQSLAEYFDDERNGLNNSLSPIERSLMDNLKEIISEHQGAPLSKISTRTVFEEGEGDDLIPAGYGALLDCIGKELLKANRIHLGVEVQKIESVSDEVRVHTSRNTIYYARQAIVTIPLGVLKKRTLQFSPPLSLKKEKAIDNVGFGTSAKIVIEFPYCFWPKEADTFYFIPPKGCKLTKPSLVINLYNLQKFPGVIMFAAPENCAAVEKMSPSELQDYVMPIFRSCFGKDVPNPIKIISTKWVSDKYCGGGYSYIPVGRTLDDLKDLASTHEGNIYFAGEHTDPVHFSTALGGYLSGIRVAKEIVTSRK